MLAEQEVAGSNPVGRTGRQFAFRLSDLPSGEGTSVPARNAMEGKATTALGTRLEGGQGGKSRASSNLAPSAQDIPHSSQEERRSV